MWRCIGDVQGLGVRAQRLAGSLPWPTGPFGLTPHQPDLIDSFSVQDLLDQRDAQLAEAKCHLTRRLVGGERVTYRRLQLLESEGLREQTDAMGAHRR